MQRTVLTEDDELFDHEPVQRVGTLLPTVTAIAVDNQEQHYTACVVM